MNEKTLRAIIDAGAVKRLRIIAEGSRFYVEADTHKGTVTASTNKGDIKNWASLDSAARWIRALGIGTTQVDLKDWAPNQRDLSI